MRIVRITRSELLTRTFRPLLESRRRITTPLQSRVEWIVVQLCVSIMLIQPFDVPAMMWFPRAVNIVTHVECFASWAACFAATAGSTSSVGGGRSGAEGRIRLTGLGEEMSTRAGCSSKREATKSRLEQIHPVSIRSLARELGDLTDYTDVAPQYIQELRNGRFAPANHPSYPIEYISSPATN